jgi:hypothetical protein
MFDIELWMVGLRFLSGLPHGARFGTAMLTAAAPISTEMHATRLEMIQ